MQYLGLHQRMIGFLVQVSTTCMNDGLQVQVLFGCSDFKNVSMYHHANAMWLCLPQVAKPCIEVSEFASASELIDLVLFMLKP